MPEKAIFLDRDRVLMEDPGFRTDPEAVSLLPGVEQALRQLAQAGYRLIVTTNQAGVAKGLFTEQALQALHEELQRQLGEKNVHLDAIYYCPYHPEGTADAYARESDDRKPKPGMLLRASREHDIDLAESWMIGDSPKDVEAGQRAGCRTIRVRTPGDTLPGEEGAADEDTQADFTVRNLVEAAKLILQEIGLARLPSEQPALRWPATPSVPTESAPALPAEPAGPAGPALGAEPPPPEPKPPELGKSASMSDSEVLQELLRLARQVVNDRNRPEAGLARLAAVMLQTLALLAGLGGVILFLSVWQPSSNPDSYYQSLFLIALAALLQLGALTFFLLSRREE